MKIGQLSWIHYGWPLLLAGLLLSGCSEILYYRQWRKPPPSSYIEPGSKKTNAESQNPFYNIDCLGGVTCFGPDEEKMSQKDGLTIKECLWKNVPYQNGKPGLMWLTFSRKGDGCWQRHQEQNGDSREPSLTKPAK
ncbi:MAG: hypothetical protein HY892_11480 [Deltaproteobacteria bacterium]|nr:hypothetical protein [Deltaproteobacteria bacterium]